MDKKNLDLITEYSKGCISKDELINLNGEDYYILLNEYLNDLNSSKLRQDITCNILNLKISSKKLGYDSDGTHDEIKPKNISTTKSKKTKLECGGSYSDLTHKRHNNYVSDNAIIHCSGFIDGNLMYIIKVPYVDLTEHFKDILSKKLPNGDEPNRYVRSASFGFKQIKKCPNVLIEFIRRDIESYSLYIGKELYNYLIKHKND